MQDDGRADTNLAPRGSVWYAYENTYTPRGRNGLDQRLVVRVPRNIHCSR
jgi:hypothetical protein